MIRVLGFLLAAAVAVSPAQGERNSQRRVQAFAKLPDWSGLWETGSSKVITNPAGQGGPDFVKASQLWGTVHPPFKPELEEQYQAGLHDAGAAAAFADSFKGCGEGAVDLEKGFPFVMDSPMVFEVTVTPEQTLLTFDHGEIRYIYTDGRSHPKQDDLWPTPMGDSVGHWQGGTLIIDTVARTPGPFMLGTPIGLSEQAHFVEHMRLVDRNTLEDQLTIEDPLRLSAPWKLTFRFARAADLDRMIPYDCEADRNPIVNGKIVIKPPDAPAQ
jgi:hypothetical protein